MWRCNGRFNMWQFRTLCRKTLVKRQALMLAGIARTYRYEVHARYRQTKLLSDLKRTEKTNFVLPVDKG